MVDFKTGEVLINDPRAVAALQFYVDLVLKHKVVPPEAMTWDFEEISPEAKTTDTRSQTFAPYGTLINDPQLSKTVGRWAWETVPGTPENAQQDLDRRPFPWYSEIRQIQGLVAEFIRMACSKNG